MGYTRRLITGTAHPPRRHGPTTLRGRHRLPLPTFRLRVYKIFQIALTFEQFDHRGEILRTNIRLVSSQWNAIMLSDPAFWTSIFVSFRQSYMGLDNESLEDGCPADLPTTAEEALERIERRIVHSKDRPRDLRLAHLAGPLTVCEFPPLHLAELIYEKSNWRSIFIECHPGSEDYFPYMFILFQPRRRLPSSTWASLQSLHLKAEADEIDLEMQQYEGLRQENPLEEALVMVLKAEAFPALRQVTLEMGRRSLQQWDLPWSQLTSLTLRYFRNAFADYLPILGKCRVLQELTIHVCLPGLTETLEPTRAIIGADRLVTLPRLRTLVLNVDTKCDILTAFVPKLILPRLHALDYYDAINADEGATSCSINVLLALSTLVKNSGSAIRAMKLRLSKMTLDDSVFGEFLSLVPTLQSLDMSAQCLTCGFLEALQHSHLTDNLESLHLYTIYQDGNSFSQSDALPKYAEWAKLWTRNKGEKKSVIQANFLVLLISHVGTGKWELCVNTTLQELQEMGYNVWALYDAV